jgi:hypothetical protein
LADVANLYTAEVSIDVNSDNAEQNYQDASQELGQKYKTYTHGEFEFYQTKTRSLVEMMNTAIDNQNLYSFAKEFNEQKIFFNYEGDDFDFDIYEDVNNGFVIAIPAGTTLSYDAELQLFAANIPDGDQDGAYFSLFYGMEKHDGDPVAELISGFEEVFGEATRGLTRDPVYNRSFQLQNNWRADYFVLQGNAPYQLDENSAAEVLPNLFLSVISNDHEAFYSVALCMVPTDREDIALAFQNGVDCINSYESNETCCNYFGWFFHVIAASQLTTLSAAR